MSLLIQLMLREKKVVFNGNAAKIRFKIIFKTALTYLLNRYANYFALINFLHLQITIPPA